MGDEINIATDVSFTAHLSRLRPWILGLQYRRLVIQPSITYTRSLDLAVLLSEYFVRLCRF